MKHEIEVDAYILKLPNEAAWQRTVVEAAKRLGWQHYHTVYSIGTEAGYPDLTLFHPVHGVLWIELKTAKGVVSQAQQDWIATIRDAGQRVYVFRPSDWFALIAALEGRPLEEEETA